MNQKKRTPRINGLKGAVLKEQFFKLFVLSTHNEKNEEYHLYLFLVLGVHNSAFRLGDD